MPRYTVTLYPVLHGVVHGEVDIPTAGPARRRLLPRHIIGEDDLLPDCHFLPVCPGLFKVKKNGIIDRNVGATALTASC